MFHKKAFALTVMLIALAGVFAGINYVNAYTSQTIQRTPVLTKSIIVPPRGYGNFSVYLNETGNYEATMELNGTLRTDYVSQSVYQTWVNGSYKPLFSNEINPNSWGGNYIPMLVYPYPEPMYHIFWNTHDSGSVEVTFKVSQVTTELAYNSFNLGFGILLIAAGAVSGLAAAFSVSKRALLVTIALSLIILSVLLINTYSKVHQPRKYWRFLDNGTAKCTCK